MRKLAVRSSGIDRLGVFAVRRISFGEKVLTFRGREEWIWNIPRDKWRFCYQVDYDRYILPTDSLSIYVNHSCTPNCVIAGKRALVAYREISKGEEITFDYSTNVGWDGFEMECNCNSRECRGVIRSYRFLPENFKARYGRKISPFLLHSFYCKVESKR